MGMRHLCDHSRPATALRGRDLRAGFSLLEVVIALSLLLLVTSVVGKTFLDSTKACTSLTKLLHVQTRAQSIMDRMVEELVTGNFTSLTPEVPTESDFIEFEKIVGTSNGEPIFGNPIRIELVNDPGDAQDGMDNNGNGLVDERCIAISENAASMDSQKVIIGTKVAPLGLTFTRTGSILLIDLTLQEVLQPGEEPRTIRLSTGVKMRNS